MGPSVDLLVEFDEHATGLHVEDRRPPHPYSVAVPVDRTGAARSKPPTSPPGAAAAADIVVAVRSAEHPSVGFPVRIRRPVHCVDSVSAVPGHRQLVLTGLITDGERRVFCRVPLTRSTTDLYAQTYADARSFVSSVLSLITVRLSDAVRTEHWTECDVSQKRLDMHVTAYKTLWRNHTFP